MRLKSLTIVAAVAALALGVVVQAEEAKKEKEKHKLGRQKIGDYTVSVIVVGDMHEDKEIDFDVKLIDAKTDPKSLRAWIGAEDAKDSEKAFLTKKTATFGGTAKVPSPLPEKAKIWVEVETDAGTAKGSYEDKHDHKH